MQINQQMIQGLMNQLGGGGGLRNLAGMLGGTGGGMGGGERKGPPPLSASGLVGAGQIRAAGHAGTGANFTGLRGPQLQEAGEQYQQGVVDRNAMMRREMASTLSDPAMAYKTALTDPRERQGGRWAGFFGLINANERGGKAPRVQYGG